MYMLDCLRIDREQTDSTVSPLRLLLQLVSFPGDRIIIRPFNETPCCSHILLENSIDVTSSDLPHNSQIVDPLGNIDIVK